MNAFYAFAGLNAIFAVVNFASRAPRAMWIASALCAVFCAAVGFVTP